MMIVHCTSNCKYNNIVALCHCPTMNKVSTESGMCGTIAEVESAPIEVPLQPWLGSEEEETDAWIGRQTRCVPPSVLEQWRLEHRTPLDLWIIGALDTNWSIKALAKIGRGRKGCSLLEDRQDLSSPRDHSLLSWKWRRRRMCEQVSESSLQDTRLRHCTRGENPEKDFHSFLLQLHRLQTMETKNKIIGREVHTAASCFCGQLTICKVCCRQWSRFGANNSETSQPA